MYKNFDFRKLNLFSPMLNMQSTFYLRYETLDMFFCNFFFALGIIYGGFKYFYFKDELFLIISLLSYKKRKNRKRTSIILFLEFYLSSAYKRIFKVVFVNTVLFYSSKFFLKLLDPLVKVNGNVKRALLSTVFYFSKKSFFFKKRPLVFSFKLLAKGRIFINIRSSSVVVFDGGLSLSSFFNRLDYDLNVIKTVYGSLGVRLWLYHRRS